jgi:hypothetical protein
MQYLLIRHAKTDANRLTRAAFGKKGAPINGLGLRQAQKLATELRRRGIDTDKERVAVSELLRTRQTAESAGFKNISVNSVLNEVKTSDPQRTQELLAKAQLPYEAIAAARTILSNPPAEKIWITHGQVIAAILVELGLSNPNKLEPDFCEITEVILK